MGHCEITVCRSDSVPKNGHGEVSRQLPNVQSVTTEATHQESLQSLLCRSIPAISFYIAIMDAVFGFAIALPIVTSTGVSVTTGVCQGVSEQRKQNAENANQTRMLKFHVDVKVEPTAVSYTHLTLPTKRIV